MSTAPVSKKRAVICLDGIVRSIWKLLPYDSSWESYVERASERRPDLEFIHLQQPHDWADLLSGAAPPYDEFVRGMADGLLERLVDGQVWDEVLVLGFSMGGLTALALAKELGRAKPEMALERLIFCSFGTPFGGVFDLAEPMLRRLHVSYLDRIVDRHHTMELFKGLLDDAKQRDKLLEVHIHAIERDELVPEHSALLPAEWLYFTEPRDGLKWSSGFAPSSSHLRPHDGFLHNEDSCGWLDDLIDELLFSPEYQAEEDARSALVEAEAEAPVAAASESVPESPAAS